MQLIKPELETREVVPRCLLLVDMFNFSLVPSGGTVGQPNKQLITEQKGTLLTIKDFIKTEQMMKSMTITSTDPHGQDATIQYPV